MDNNKILAVVNGKEITDRDIYNTLVRFPEDRQQQFKTEEGRKQLLEQLICFELIYNHATKENMNEDELYKMQLETVKKEFLTQYTINKILSKAQVDDDDAKEFYKNNMSKFLQEESVRAKHILVDNLEKAEEIIKELNNGKSFEQAAKEYSSCPSKSVGGDLGYFTRGKMVPEFEDAALDLNVGEISKPVKTQFGYHIIKVEDKKEPSVKAYEEVKDSIMNNLVMQKQNDIYINLIDELKKEYGVEYK